MAEKSGLFAFLLVGGAAVAAPFIPGSGAYFASGKEQLEAFVERASNAIQREAPVQETAAITKDQPVADIKSAEGDEKESTVIADGADGLEAKETKAEPEMKLAAKVDQTAKPNSDLEIVDIAKPALQSASESTKPKMELLRVEPDGSTLVSGRASAGATIELRNGDEVVGSTKADSNGDFVLLTDQFLPKGDYQLNLTAKTDGSDKTVFSEQSAVISIPEKGNEGQLLALLTDGDSISDIIAKPKVASDAVADPILVKPDQTDIALNDQTKNAEKAVAEEATQTASIDTSKLAQDVPKPVDELKVTDSKVPALETGKEQSTAKKPSESDVPENAPDKATKMLDVATALVEAVEIEERRVFVAGSGTSGAEMNLYLDNKFIGRAKVGLGDRFLFEKDITIAAGEHNIRIDVLSADGSKVVSRAQVPFTREETKSLVASIVKPKDEVKPNIKVAKQDASSEKTAEAKITDPKVEEKVGVVSTKADTKKDDGEIMVAAKAANVEANTPVDATASAPAEQVAKLGETKTAKETMDVKSDIDQTNLAARADTPSDSASPAKPDLTAKNSAEPKVDGVKEEVLTAAKGVVATGQKASGDGAETKEIQTAKLDDEPELLARDTSDKTGKSEKTEIATLEKPLVVKPATSTETEEPSVVASSTEKADEDVVPTTTYEVSETKDSSVIIRRGDTLWRISRRVYGKGVRYTTIYLANQKQIKNPDLIYPGQVFDVPDES